MNTNKGLNILLLVIGVLVLCNIGLMFMMWYKPAVQEWQPGKETPRDFVVRSLNFNPDQTAKYDILVKAHQQAMRRLRDEAGAYRQQLYACIKNVSAGNAPDSLAQLIANSQKQIETVTYAHFAQVRLLCTEAQKQQFDHITGPLTQMMSHGGGGHHPPPPPRDGGPEENHAGGPPSEEKPPPPPNR